MKEKQPGDPISWAFAGGFLIRQGVVVSVEKYGYVVKPIGKSQVFEEAKVRFEQVVK